MDTAPPPEFPPAARWLCPHARDCPGCPLIHLGYGAQLAHKHAQVASALALYPELRDLPLRATNAAAQLLGYRTRAKLVAKDGALGLYKRGTHDVVDIPDCLVLDAQVSAAVHAVRGLVRPDVALEGLDVARVGEELLVTLIVAQDAAVPPLRALAEQLRAAIPAVKGVAYARRADEAVQLLGTGHELLSGMGELREQRANGPHHYVAFGAFMQAHESTSRAIYQQLVERVSDSGPKPRVLELYAGSGALSLALAQGGADVTAVESYEPACERLHRAAHEQQLNVAVRHGDAARELDGLRAAGASFDVVLVNPPRRGLDPRVRNEIARMGARHIGYVSCKPSTLARDLSHLARLGFRAQSLQPFDMMPLADQVETLAWLTAAPVAQPELLHDDNALLVVNKAGHELARGTGPGSLEQRLRSVDREDLVPVTDLLAGSSGALVFAKERLSLTAEPMHTFLALVRGVVRPRGQLRAGAARARFTRREVVAGHSLVLVETTGDEQVLRAFRVIGHPVIGDQKADRATAKHFAMRHGLDRTFLHANEVRIQTADADLQVRAPLAPDLAAVLEALGASALTQTL